MQKTDRSIDMKNELTTKKTMTVKEVSEALGVSIMAIHRVLKSTNSLNGTVKVRNGVTVILTEAQATAIKMELQKHHNLPAQLVSFNFDGNDVRVIEKDNNPWWIAKDVCDVLELGNVSMSIERLDEDEKGISKVDTLGGMQNLKIVNESGLYSLIIRSNKLEAKKFKRWITHEVLPQIRKTGNYSSVPATLKDALLLAYNQQCEIEEKNALLIEAQPKLETYDNFIENSSYQSMGTVAKIIGIGRNKLFEKLRELGILQSGDANRNMPYQTHISAGYFVVKEFVTDNVVKAQTFVTPKGLVYISKQIGAE